MITLIIPSKDRACQLDLLLRSLQNSQTEFYTTVLYKASNKEFQLGYEKLFDYPVTFTREVSFQDDLLDLSRGKLVSICCDDNVFYRPIPKLDYNITSGKVFSLRLGLNTIVQDHSIGSVQPVLNQYADLGDIIEWNPKQYHPHANYGYPFSLDAHIFDTKQFIDLATRFKWKNTNELEGGLFNYKEEINVLASFKESVSVNVPLNNLSGITSHMNISPAYLNERFLLGERLRLPDNVNVIGCHQAINLTLN